VHGNHDVCLQVQKGPESLFGAGVDGAVAIREVGADGEQGNVGVEAACDLGKAVEVCRVAGVIDRRTGCGCDHIAPEAAMRVVEHARAPMASRRCGDCDGRRRGLRGERALPPDLD